MYSTATAETIEYPYPYPYPSKELIVNTALELVGSPSHKYVYNHPELGQSPRGFDCSGFVRFVLLQSGFHIPNFIGMDDVERPIRHTNEFWDHYGASIQTLPESGDLIFFSRHGLFPTHIGIMRDSERYIHAPGNDDTKVAIGTIATKAIATNGVDGRVLFHTNPIGYKAPTLPYDAPTYRHHQQLAE